MTKKIQVPVLNKEQKIELFNKVSEVNSFLPVLPLNYRWVLKVSKDVFNVFALELQKKEVIFWKRSRSFNVSFQNIKDNGSVEGYLKQCAQDLIEWEEKTLLENAVPQVNWIIEDEG